MCDLAVIRAADDCFIQRLHLELHGTNCLIEAHSAAVSDTRVMRLWGHVYGTHTVQVSDTYSDAHTNTHTVMIHLQ